MKKSTFVNLIAGTIGGLLFALGMCMCLLPEWNAFQIGVVVTAVGAVILLAQAIATWIRSGRKIRINWKLTGKVLFGIFSALALGVVSGYKKVEACAVSGFQKVSDKFIEKFFSREGETVEETRERLSRK